MLWGRIGALRFSLFNAAWELAALKHPTPSSLIRCDAWHALRFGQETESWTTTAGCTIRRSGAGLAEQMGVCSGRRD